MRSRTVFLDRDGVINKQPAPHDYVKNWNEFQWLPKTKETIKGLNKAGFLVIVVSNQRGVVRGMMKMENVEEIHQKMNQELQELGGKIDAFYFCPHNYSDHCQCRKPKIGMLLKAADDFNIDLKKAIVIGDSKKDIQMGKKASCVTILVLSGETRRKKETKGWSVKPDWIAQDLPEAVEMVLTKIKIN